MPQGLPVYAIIRAGGKQAKVQPGDVIDIERVKNVTDSITFTPILVVDDQGKAVSDRAALEGTKVVAEVLGESQGDKIDIFKYKNKSGYRRRMGHRQRYTTIKVTAIEMPKSKTRTKASEKAEENSEETDV
jgi:large subunit ribosomal protein L21